MVPAVLVILAAPGKVRVLADRVLAKVPVAGLVTAVETEPALVMALVVAQAPAAATRRRDRINNRASKTAKVARAVTVVKAARVVKVAAMPVTNPVVMRAPVTAKIPPMPPRVWASVAGNPATVQTRVQTTVQTMVQTAALARVQTRVQATAPDTVRLGRVTPEMASNLVDPAHRARLSRRRNNNELQLGAAL